MDYFACPVSSHVWHVPFSFHPFYSPCTLPLSYVVVPSDQVGWARVRWGPELYSKTFPALARAGLLRPGCQIWLPNISCTEESLMLHRGKLDPYFDIQREKNASANPLFVATEMADAQLRLSPDNRTNESQMMHLNKREPFFVLTLRSGGAAGIARDSSLARTLPQAPAAAPARVHARASPIMGGEFPGTGAESSIGMS